MSRWIKGDYLWIDQDSGDAGDIIYNSMSKIIDMEDRSIWANDSLSYCIALLDNHQRWPDMLNQENTAKNFLQWWLNDKYSRPQHFLTRDPYYSVICCAEFLKRADEIESIKIPWYCFSPAMWIWRRKLIKDNRPNWRKRLTHYKALATQIATSDDPNIIANKKEAGLI